MPSEERCNIKTVYDELLRCECPLLAQSGHPGPSASFVRFWGQSGHGLSEGMSPSRLFHNLSFCESNVRAALTQSLTVGGRGFSDFETTVTQRDYLAANLTSGADI